MKEIDNLLTYLGVLLLFVNCILFFKTYNSKTDKEIKYFSFYLAAIFIINTTGIVLARNVINNLFLSHFYFIFQFILLSLFYKELFNSKQKLIVNILGTLILATLGVQYLYNPDIFYRFNLLEIFLTSFPLVVYSIIHLYNSLSKDGKYMYINSGVLIYLTTSTLIFILGNILSDIDNRQTTKNIWLLNKILYNVYLILILLEWRKNLSQIKNS